MNKLLCLTLFTMTYSISTFASLDCKSIEKKQDSEGNITYFKEIKGYKIPNDVKSKILRSAVSNFYGECGVTWNKDFCYRKEMTDKEVVELGEEAFTLALKVDSKTLYYAANVGFGGGNSAVYFFNPKDLSMEQVMVVDGAECRPIQSILGYE